ncbi:hypothetical protein FGG08_003481 [Glutinoglossum americanum]|uniref:Uncharacterized protein n=1 Tax=Glutinoglossum americanum TaxID=1670608 RepID=A0A9P8I2G6_9PEZI|nr:hypothetical protein FGG08_003481 [Glutinoglossum americanum]
MSSGNPHLGATFYPGGSDDFYMPEVISPSPQRVMPEVPEQIQENLAHLELEAINPKKEPEPQSPTQPQHPQSQSYHEPQATSSAKFPPRGASLMSEQYNGHSGQREQAPPVAPAGSYAMHGGGVQAQGHDQYQYHGVASRDYDESEQPSFSPFPKLHNPPSNVPPSDEEKEATLESARIPVLNSNDPETQLAWAQDALAYVEVAMQHERRITENDPNQPPRVQTPRVEHQLRVDAINVVSFLADQGHPKAEFMRGMWLEFAKFGFRMDKKEAYRSYVRAAEKGYARAEYRMGMQFENSNESMKAIKHYNQGAAQGDSASNYRLGMMTLLGQHGQKQDYTRGVQLIRLAADSADENAPQGAYVYGMLLARELPGIDVPEVFLPYDLKAARTNVEKAAYLGFARAQLKMGQAYELCQLGCEFNAALSLHYNALAARQGEAEADMAISKWFLCGQEGVFERDEELAFIYAKRAAESGLPTAEFAMGYFYEIGHYASVDLKEAQNWYRKAAEHGNKDATGRLDGISRSKTLSRKDHERVAVAKIQSMHGSQRGKRPARFQNPVQPLPAISDDAVDIPAGPAGYGYDASASNPGGSGPDQTYLNPFAGNQIPQRPATTTPYPTEDGPPRLSPRPGSAFGINPNIRPSSAFGINPNIRPISGTASPQRPYSTTGEGPSRGRGGGRVVSGPVTQPSYNAQVGRGRGGSPGSGFPQDDLNRSTPPRLDIGFSAPAEPPQEKKHKLQKPNSRAPQNTQLPISDSQPPQPSRVPTIQQPISQNQGYGGDFYPQGGHPGPRPLRKESLGKAGQANAPVPSSNRQSQGAPAPAGYNQISAQQKTSTSGLPGKGPKTFEEMGVPQGKKEDECLVM